MSLFSTPLISVALYVSALLYIVYWSRTLQGGAHERLVTISPAATATDGHSWFTGDISDAAGGITFVFFLCFLSCIYALAYTLAGPSQGRRYGVSLVHKVPPYVPTTYRSSNQCPLNHE